MQINLQNIDELILKDKNVVKKLPQFNVFFERWLLGTKVPALRSLAQESKLKLLEKLDNDEVVKVLENYFNEKVTIFPIDYHIAKNYEITLAKAEKNLNEIDSFVGDFAISRDANKLYMSSWRI